MAVDREQVKREAQRLLDVNEAADEFVDEVWFADRCLSLLAELEQAERERDEAREANAACLRSIAHREDQLAAAERREAALAEALREIEENGIGDSRMWWDGKRCGEVARNALAAYEASQ